MRFFWLTLLITLGSQALSKEQKAPFPLPKIKQPKRFGMAKESREFKQSTIPLNTKRQNHDAGQYFVKVNVDGESLIMVLDTGAKFSHVPEKPPFDSYRINGFINSKGLWGQSHKVNTIVVNEVKLGSSNIKNHRVAKSSDHKLLGMRTLKGSAFTISNGNKTELQLVPTSSGKLTNPIQRLGEDLIVIPVAIGDQVHSMIFDTGASMTVFDSSINFPQKPTKISKEAIKLMDSNMASKTRHIFQTTKIIIDGVQFENVNFMNANLSGLKGKSKIDIKGIIGFNVISKANWSFDLAKNFFSASKL